MRALSYANLIAAPDEAAVNDVSRYVVVQPGGGTGLDT